MRALVMVIAGLAHLAEPAGAAKRPVSEADAREGRALFVTECSACHGERGAGDGPAAEWYDPRPRDLTRGIFKLQTTESGESPTTADVVRTIEQGIPGTSMPAFSFLTAEERHQLAAYVLRVADLLDEPEPQPIPDPGQGSPVTAQSVARGKEVYARMKCGDCHGEKGRGDGASAKTLKDDGGRPVKVRDFTSGIFRGGNSRKDLYYRFTTGMSGSPMPSYGDSVSGEDRWALVDYVMALKVPVAVKPLPQDPIKGGREVAVRYQCRGCHVLDDGKGGAVGPDLRISGQKLDSDWVRRFVKAPREHAKIYPWRPYRMPHLGLSDEEANAVVRYLAAMGKRAVGPVGQPNLAAVNGARVEEGKNLFVLRCAECHALGKVIETPLAKQQGPDLARVVGRVDFEWAKRWILDPKKIDPKTKMTVPGLTPDQVEAVGLFVWKTSSEAPK